MVTNNPSPARVGGGTRRRSSAEVRAVILDVAEKLFEERGYGSTTTRDVAVAAKIAEPLIFRHFGSKANLFRITILDPFIKELDLLAEEFDVLRPARDFFGPLYRLLRRERGKVTALLSASTFDDAVEADGGQGSGSPIGPVFSSLERVTADDVEHFHFQHVDVGLTTSITVGSLLGLVAFEDWLFPDGLAETTVHELITETLLQTVHGLAHRPPPASDRGGPGGTGREG